MSEPKRRFLDRASPRSTLVTIIGAETVLCGGLRGKGQFVVWGEIHGDGDLEGSLHLAASAAWFGTIRAQQALIAGKLIGDLLITDTVEIGRSAVIRGRVTARTIAIAEGAVLDGPIEVASDGAVLRFEEKRHREPV